LIVNRCEGWLNPRHTQTNDPIFQLAAAIATAERPTAPLFASPLPSATSLGAGGRTLRRMFEKWYSLWRTWTCGWVIVGKDNFKTTELFEHE
jgi:hypothetical protein